MHIEKVSTTSISKQEQKQWAPKTKQNNNGSLKDYHMNTSSPQLTPIWTVETIKLQEPH